MFHPPNDPADRPQPGDPPINAESMIEVIKDFLDDTDRRRAAGKRMLAIWAMKAILDGGNVRSIANAIGFTNEREDDRANEEVDAFFRSQGVPTSLRSMFVIDLQDGRADPICAFHDFLFTQLKEFIHEQAETQR
jgi:hypothetical protein